MATKDVKKKHYGRSRGAAKTGRSRGAKKAEESTPKPSPVARRKQREREERLALIKRQVKEGTLTIRKMTKAERKKYPPPAGQDE